MTPEMREVVKLAVREAAELTLVDHDARGMYPGSYAKAGIA